MLSSIILCSALECQQQCEGMDGCTHFTYLKEDHPETGRRGQCCLKNGQVCVLIYKLYI